MRTELAGLLREAERNGQPIAPICSATEDRSIEHAYRIQRENVQLRLRAGERIVGRKIGLTSAAVRNQLGVDQPDFGVLFESMEVHDNGTLEPAALIQPRIEAEIGFVLARDLDCPAPGRRDVAAAVDHVTPCLEIVDSRIINWSISIFDTVADNAAAARFVAGTRPQRLSDVDVVHCGMVLRQNGQVVATGAGADCLGDPIEAVRWLAAKAFELEDPLRAGDIVLSGALGRMVPLRSGVNYMAVISGLGWVTVNTAGAPG